jgi:hypothetical protein
MRVRKTKLEIKLTWISMTVDPRLANTLGGIVLKSIASFLRLASAKLSSSTC